MLHEAGEDAVNWLESTTVQPQIIQKLYNGGRWRSSVSVTVIIFVYVLHVFGYGQGWQNML